MMMHILETKNCESRSGWTNSFWQSFICQLMYSVYKRKHLSLRRTCDDWTHEIESHFLFHLFNLKSSHSTKRAHHRMNEQLTGMTCRWMIKKMKISIILHHRVLRMCDENEWDDEKSSRTNDSTGTESYKHSHDLTIVSTTERTTNVLLAIETSSFPMNRRTDSWTKRHQTTQPSTMNQA